MEDNIAILMRIEKKIDKLLTPAKKQTSPFDDPANWDPEIYDMTPAQIVQMENAKKLKAEKEAKKDAERKEQEAWEAECALPGDQQTPPYHNVPRYKEKPNFPAPDGYYWKDHIWGWYARKKD